MSDRMPTCGRSTGRFWCGCKNTAMNRMVRHVKCTGWTPPMDTRRRTERKCNGRFAWSIRTSLDPLERTMQRHKMPIQAALGLIFFILLMDVVGMSILYPVAPYIVRRYSSHALMLTVLTAIYATAQFFAAPVL